MRVAIRLPGAPLVETVTVDDGQAAVIGRQPDILGPSSRGGERFAVAVASPAVSANHATISLDGEVAHIVDHGSRNGTWLKVPATAEVAVSSARALTLEVALAAPLAGTKDPDLPAEAQWNSRADFAKSLTSSITAWLQRRDPSVRVELQRTADSREVLDRFPLATSEALTVRSERTIDSEWLDVLSRISAFVSRQNRLFEAEEELRDDGLIVSSIPMKNAVRSVVEAAERGARSLVLVGPSGAGKEGLARCYHRRTRPQAPFISRNCGLFNFGKDLVVSELFGAERGTFTGAVRPIVGAVEAANGGTLFLDEIGELGLDVQAALLRFLDHGEYQRLGAPRPAHADVHVVGATNKDLRGACLKGEFRRDFWFRLSTHVIDVPPLSQRFDDIIAYLKSRELPGGENLFDAFSPGAVDVLRAHTWEGNFRELINFAGRLPRMPGTIDSDTCRRALAEGALHPVVAAPPRPAATNGGDWAILVQTARSAFAEDQGVDEPRSWDDVKLFLESYLKPLLFARLSGVNRSATLDAVDIGDAAAEVQADRGTARKQIERYFARFASNAS